MSEKLSERMNRDGGHSTVYVPEVAALEQQLAAKNEELAEADENNNSLSRCLAERGNVIAAKDAEIARLRDIHNERIAQLTAHRVCCGTEHDPLNGKLHGFCVVCGVPWPCEYAGMPIALAETPAAPLTALALPEDDVLDAAPEVK